MILALVQHFFNEEGQCLFPEWLESIAREASRYDGFISLRRLSLPDDPTACFMLLEFADAERLRIWVNSPERARLLAEQAPYRLRELQPQRFIASPPIET
jgi:antibiotic biosynthesis monooxygenase (ABM) superfamily enzyme